ncbi:MAG: hypothetical protein R3B48_29290 [Kofleriaceae bacterium]
MHQPSPPAIPPFLAHPYPAHGAPRRTPPVRNALRRFAITFGAIAGGIALLAGGLWIHGRITPQHQVLVENALDVALKIRVGDERFELPAGQHRSVKVHDGALALEAEGPGDFRDRATLELPASSWRVPGRVAVYNPARKPTLAVVSATYGSPPGATPEPVELLPTETSAVVLPPRVAGELDEAFPESVKAKYGRIIQHLCHVDLEAKTVGCPNAL